MIKWIRRWWISSVACDEDSDKICPHLRDLEITAEGTIKAKATSIAECCKGQRVLEQMYHLNKK